MKNLWTILVSYFKDVLLDSRESEFHGVLEVYLRKGHYMLTTPGAIQSFGIYYYNFRQILNKIRWDSLAIENVLILGTGLGSVIEVLERIQNKNFNYTAVEVDDEVIDLMGKYKLKSLKSSIEIIHTDALHFMNQNRRKFDMILVDIYLDDEVPNEFLTLDFVCLLKQSLTSSGFFIQNLIELDSMNKEEKNTEYLEKVQNKFPLAVVKKEVNSAMIVSNKDFLK